MKIPYFLRVLSYHPLVRQAIRALHLGSIARRLYCRLAYPRAGILRVRIGGVTVNFYVRPHDDLRMLEGVLLIEQHLIERLASTLGPGDIVYDIGAAVGSHTIPLAKED